MAFPHSAAGVGCRKARCLCAAFLARHRGDQLKGAVKMTTYYVCANDAHGFYEASNEQAARDAFAADAGYRDEADMVAQLEHPSEICAKPATVEIGQRVSYDGAVALMDRETLEEVCDRLHDEAGRLGTRGPSPQEIADAYCAAHAERFGEAFVVN